MSQLPTVVMYDLRQAGRGQTGRSRTKLRVSAPVIRARIAALAAWGVSGWRLNAWSAALLAIVLGLASLLVPAASALGTIWAALAIVWGAAFISAAEVRARGQWIAPSGRPEREEVAPA